MHRVVHHSRHTSADLRASDVTPTSSWVHCQTPTEFCCHSFNFLLLIYLLMLNYCHCGALLSGAAAAVKAKTHSEQVFNGAFQAEMQPNPNDPSLKVKTNSAFDGSVHPLRQMINHSSEACSTTKGLQSCTLTHKAACTAAARAPFCFLGSRVATT